MLAALVDDARGAEAILALGAELAAIEQSPLPVIAAVSGDVFGGGCEIVLLCDLVIVEGTPPSPFATRRWASRRPGAG